jgi:phosphatidylinositol 4-phosphatase
MRALTIQTTHNGLLVGSRISQQWHLFSTDENGGLKISPFTSVPPGSSPSLRAPFEADAIFGVFSLLRGPYLAVVTSAKEVSTSPWLIYQATCFEFLPITSSNTLSASELEEENLYLSLLKRIADTKSFYFGGAGIDITNSLQRLDTLSGNTNPTQNIIGCDDRFFWNRSACREIVAAGAHELVYPMINGFVQSVDVKSSSSNDATFPSLSMVLISRRACTRVGTRFNVRGADADGNVANFVETEQILVLGNGAFSSFVQTRGSIPLLWEQSATMKYAPKCILNPKKESGLASFQRHISQQLDRYFGRVVLVNLIDKKGDQKVLGTTLSEACEKFGLGTAVSGGRLSYVWFDFHHETRGMKWENMYKLVDQVKSVFDTPEQCFNRDSRGVVTSRQTGVVRTNCMDNLDRTNVVQSIFARQAILSSIPGALEASKRAGYSILTSPFVDFEQKFNNLWADNADALSILYSGTGALKTDFTRTGKRTLRGLLQDGFNSVHRYVINNLSDGSMQDAWDLFTGRFVVVKNAKGALLSPARAHMNEMTPTGFAFRTFLLFYSLSLTFTFIGKMGFPTLPLKRSNELGTNVAVAALGGIAYLLIKRGIPSLGKRFVNKPVFIKHGGASDAVGGGAKASSSSSVETTSGKLA